MISDRQEVTNAIISSKVPIITNPAIAITNPCIARGDTKSDNPENGLL